MVWQFNFRDDWNNWDPVADILEHKKEMEQQTEIDQVSNFRETLCRMGYTPEQIDLIFSNLEQTENDDEEMDCDTPNPMA